MMIYTAVNITKDRVSVLTSMAKGAAYPLDPNPPLLWYCEGHDPYHSLLGSAFPFWVLLLSSQTLHLQMVQVPSMYVQNSISLWGSWWAASFINRGMATVSGSTCSSLHSSVLCPACVHPLPLGPGQPRARPPLPGQQLYARHVLSTLHILFS